MPIDSEGRFRPEASPKQDELRELCRRKRFVLANGPRFSGKTIGALGAVCEHAWNTSPGNIGVITVSQTVGKDSGIWNDLTRIFIPEWIAGDFGFDWVREPYTSQTSKKPTCEVTNYKSLDVNTTGLSPDDKWRTLRTAGATTEIQLESLKVESEVEERFKPRRYSMLYVPELTTFHNRKTFNTWTECLRMIGLPEHKHLFLADSNPPDDESWWIHDLWWDLVDADEATLNPTDFGFPEDAPEAMQDLIALKRGLARIDITVEDNPYASPEHVRLLRAKYADNDEMYRRYILGECVRTTEGSLFYKVFRPNIHVVGEGIAKGGGEPEILVPEPTTYQLSTGHDPGGTNYGSCIVERFIPDKKLCPKYNGHAVFKVLDELVVIGGDYNLYDFIESFIEKMDFWENQMDRVGNVEWLHWADRSVYDMRVPFVDRLWATEIMIASGNRLPFVAAARGKGSIQVRIDLLRRLLYEERIFISAQCTNIIAMIKSIKRGTTAAGGIQRGSVHKHAFDALTYLLASECADELTTTLTNSLSHKKDNYGSQLIQSSF